MTKHCSEVITGHVIASYISLDLRVVALDELTIIMHLTVVVDNPSPFICLRRNLVVAEDL